MIRGKSINLFLMDGEAGGRINQHWRMDRCCIQDSTNDAR